MTTKRFNGIRRFCGYIGMFWDAFGDLEIFTFTLHNILRVVYVYTDAKHILLYI